MIVYGDLLFLINFSMDFLCFYFSCLLLHKTLPVVRVCIAATLGGIYSVAALFFSPPGTLSFAIDVLVLCVMCLIVYASRTLTLWRYVKLILLYFFVSSLLGGLMTALFSLLNRLDIFAGESGENDVNMWVFVLLAALGSIFTLKGGAFFRSSPSKKSAKLILRRGSSTVELKVLLDSGNLASEPISGRAVAFANLEVCRPLLEKELFELISSCGSIEDVPLYVSSEIRLVPAKTVTGNVLVPALRIKRASIISGKINKDIDIYVALIRDNRIDGFDAIISGEVLI